MKNRDNIVISGDIKLTFWKEFTVIIINDER
jgi:hypothetical protein